ncbi:pleckstrin homology domain-containing family O member 1b isoform X1 [Rhinichthys klamathensis goyatoka]|uniref:pleckstrin homology domain-containing family O member 1b isoform X1 n=1 Tax=Rhinichthys klamathensis goyatoka TaxID=3034132 RepID=UPI0024B61D92|nr:pleckstrin homology domain-containing family O member 1b isoform X1 [Rhinichthys klamathensis goyatoka]
MKKNSSTKRGSQEANQQPVQPDKTGWIRKFCGKGIFREIWKNRFVLLKGDQLYISEKELLGGMDELHDMPSSSKTMNKTTQRKRKYDPDYNIRVKDEKKIQEVVDLTDYERSEELRKAKSRSKKNHSKFTLLRSRQPGNTVPNLVFLAVSPEEKESWINALNAAITRAKNRILDEVTVEEDSLLAHPTRDRAKIPHTRRLPTRGHLMAVASTTNSDGMLTLDLIQEEDVLPEQGQDSLEDTLDKAASQHTLDSQRSNPDTLKLSTCNETPGKSQSLPRKSESAFDWSENHRTPQLRKKPPTSEKNRCASMDEILTHCETRALPHCSTSAPVQPISQLQDLITQKLERTQELLTEVRAQGKGKGSPAGKSSGPEVQRIEAERLLEEAASTWGQARDVLEEVKELRALYKQLDSAPLSPSQNGKLNSPQANHRKSMM